MIPNNLLEDDDRLDCGPEELRELIEQSFLTQEEAAHKIGISPRAMRNYLSMKDPMAEAPYPVAFAVRQLVYGASVFDAQRATSAAIIELLDMLKEDERDGRGLRFIVPALYVNGGQNRKAIAWFEQEKSEQPMASRDAISYFYEGLAWYRAGNKKKAERSMLLSYSRNIHFLWSTTRCHDEYTRKNAYYPIDGVWYGSNLASPEIYAWMHPLMKPAVTDIEGEWISEKVESSPFHDMREKYIDTHKRLGLDHTFVRDGQTYIDTEARRAISKEWHDYLWENGLGPKDHPF